MSTALPFKDVPFTNMIGQPYSGYKDGKEFIRGHIWGVGNSEGFKGPYTLHVHEGPGPMVDGPQPSITITAEAAWEDHGTYMEFLLPSEETILVSLKCRCCGK